MIVAWPEQTLLSAHTGGGGIYSPQRAYAHMPDDVKLAAAVVDAVIWDDLRWAESVLSVILGEPEPATSTRTQAFFASREWRDVHDLYAAARVTPAQQRALELHIAGYTHREIGGFMGTTALAAQLQVFKAFEKLKRVCIHEEAA